MMIFLLINRVMHIVNKINKKDKKTNNIIFKFLLISLLLNLIGLKSYKYKIYL